MALYHDNAESREQLVNAMRRLSGAGLSSGSSGNVSLRTERGMLVTPTGVPPADLTSAKIVSLQLDGTVDADQLLPSSEWRMHADIYAARPGLAAVVHCHSTYATILACAHKPIPPQHYMIAMAGSVEIPLAPYARFGSQALSDAALAALSSSRACLLANHGQLATGENLQGALQLAELVEELAHWYWGALAIGGPKLLNSSQMEEVMAAFEGYGQQSPGAAPAQRGPQKT
jgi:L-fuculose-phosphate aldolase